MNKPLTLSTAPLEALTMDYARLRQQGIQLLQQLGDQTWTDFNAHDPGITILEQVCYALTDLAYRIGYELPDLLAEGRDPSDTEPLSSLYTPAQILPIQPVTLLDLRKTLLDIDGVKNAWIEAVEKPDPGLLYDAAAQTLYLDKGQPQAAHCVPMALTGLYRVLLETDERQGMTSTNFLPDVIDCLHRYRQLGADFLPPQALKTEAITVLAKIEIGKVDNPEQLLAEIWHVLSVAISPRVRFWTLAERLALGQPIDTIFDGPLLQNGFIDDAELEQLQRKTGLRSSDLLQVLMAVPGVSLITSLALANEAMLNKPEEQLPQFFKENFAENTIGQAWYLTLDAQKTPALNLDLRHGSSIGLYRNGIRVQVNCQAALTLLAAKQKRVAQRGLLVGESASESTIESELPLPRGRNRHIGRYYSLLHQFPALYGIGSDGLPDSSTPQRQAQSRQLKAYLMFFDQLLANYFAQLAHVKDLFSFDAGGLSTYFTQAVPDPDGKLDLSSLYVAAGVTGTEEVSTAQDTENSYDDQLAALGSSEKTGTPLGGRKNRLLNHLLARFGEHMTDYALAQANTFETREVIAAKSAFLQQYREIGLQRPSGFNYSLDAADNVSGLERRIRGLLGLPAANGVALTSTEARAEDGFYVLEHILLRPRGIDLVNTSKNHYLSLHSPLLTLLGNLMQADPYADPYSHRISFIFPEWNKRFQQAEFRQLIKKTVRDETPAHLHVRICWLSQDAMCDFEAAYQTWRRQTIATQWWDSPNLRADDNEGWKQQLQLRDARDALIRLIELGQPWPLRDLRLSYPSMVAFDTRCKITLLAAQSDCRYQLCDEDGNPIADCGAVPAQLSKPWQQAHEISLDTPPIKKDISFTILAMRDSGQISADSAASDLLETWLAHSVSIQVGINTRLALGFQAARQQVDLGNTLIANYNDKVEVYIEQSQAGISYILVAAGSDVSAPVAGNKNRITLVSNLGFAEDTLFKVRAYRTEALQRGQLASKEKTLGQNVPDTLNQAILMAELTLHVRPNPALTLECDKAIAEFRSDVQLTLHNVQPSVEYRLYRRNLRPSEYLPDNTNGAILITGEAKRKIAIKPPAPITDWNNTDGFTLYKTFSAANNAGKATVEIGALEDDALCVVLALKKNLPNDTRLQLGLSQALALLVRPDPTPKVAALEASVRSGTKGVVTVENTQRGVQYHLRRDNNPPRTSAGYHWEDRGIGTMRVEIDLVLNSVVDRILRLPTAKLTQETHFNVLATKTLSGVSVALTAKATIGIKSS